MICDQITTATRYFDLKNAKRALQIYIYPKNFSKIFTNVYKMSLI